MREILDRLLNIARPERETSFEPVGIEMLVGDLVSLNSAMAAEQDVRIVVEVEEGLVTLCDPRKIKQILLNLLQNAVEAAPAESVVGFSAKRIQDGSTLFLIDDEGSGLQLWKVA